MLMDIENENIPASFASLHFINSEWVTTFSMKYATKLMFMYNIIHYFLLKYSNNTLDQYQIPSLFLRLNSELLNKR